MNADLRGLAPCPFCGEAADPPFKSGKSRNKNVLWDVSCSDTLCGARRIGSTEGEAVASWNQRAALSVAQGQGFVMVPRVPTEAMRAAATKIEWGGDEVDHCWAAMIAAAPPAGDKP